MMRGTLKIAELTAAMALPVALIFAPASPMAAAITVAATFFLAIATYRLYAEAMRLKDLRDKNQLSLWHYPWAVVVLGIGLPFDAALNVVAGLYWRERPRWGEILLTTRLQRWVKDAAHPARQAWAQAVCAELNRHDEGHC
ncbi:hypothetical protein [Thioalkalivibrio sp. ALE12]|uniref:hypothetical protein n=1 Tax=Thioalkalivibrio sp. ALE12 TaxID=1158170 RepID=UPI0012DC3562|nr:hypothetical protein [Thioalkalivibrio sp. ALE12]